MKTLITLGLILSVILLRAQSDNIYTTTETMPRFYNQTCETKSTLKEKEACAQMELLNYLITIKYPQVAIDSLFEGKAYVRFVIYEDGSVNEVTVARQSDHSILDIAAVKHIKNMPNWVPGTDKDGTPVKVQYILPINFSLGYKPKQLEKMRKKLRNK